MKPYTVILFTLFILTINMDLHAQRDYYGQKRKYYIGLEGNTGVRHFSLNSKDIQRFANMDLSMEGYSVGLITGTGKVQFKLKSGFFAASSLNRVPVKGTEAEFGLRIYPLNSSQKAKSYFKPYLLVGMTKDNLSFSGSYLMTIPPKPQPMEEQCTCTCDHPMHQLPGNQPMGDPDALSEQPTTEERELGKMTILRANAGTGLTIHLPGKQTFVNMFAELVYSTPVEYGGSSNFLKTRSSSSMVCNLGIAIGLNRNN